MNKNIQVFLSINQNNTPHSNYLDWCEGNFFNLHKVTKMYEYSATNFHEGKRSNNFAIGVSSIILDFDDGLTLNSAKKLFEEYIALIITTKSHLKNKNGLVSDRFRVILPLNYSIIDTNYYMSIMAKIVRFFKSDKACTDAARYYYPNKDQITYYSKGTKFFNPSRFDDFSKREKEIIYRKDIQLNKSSQKYESEIYRVDLNKFRNNQITYYLNGDKRIDTLSSVVENINEDVQCHCFMNPKHEDKNPSCRIYQNEKNTYIKCFACNFDGIIYKE